jgi:hypothetical protein
MKSVSDVVKFRYGVRQDIAPPGKNLCPPFRCDLRFDRAVQVQFALNRYRIRSIVCEQGKSVAFRSGGIVLKHSALPNVSFTAPPFSTIK